jgi:AcrR family transcriptional regulator
LCCCGAARTLLSTKETKKRVWPFVDSESLAKQISCNLPNPYSTRPPKCSPRQASIGKALGIAESQRRGQDHHNYFKNKDDILISIFSERIGELNRSLREAVGKTDDPDEKLAIILTPISILGKDKVVTMSCVRPEILLSTAISSVIELLDIITEAVGEGRRRHLSGRRRRAVVSLTMVGILEDLIHVWVLSDKVPEMKSKYDISLQNGIDAFKQLMKTGLHREKHQHQPKSLKSRKHRDDKGLSTKPNYTTTLSTSRVGRGEPSPRQTGRAGFASGFPEGA